MQVHAIVAQIVDRQHVGASNREVIRALASAMKGGPRGWYKIDRTQRRKWMRQAIYQHGKNLGVYMYVMGGLR